MHEDLADLVGRVGILVRLRIMVVEQELSVAVLADWPRMRLDLRHHAKRFGDIGIEYSRRANARGR